MQSGVHTLSPFDLCEATDFAPPAFLEAGPAASSSSSLENTLEWPHSDLFLFVLPALDRPAIVASSSTSAWRYQLSESTPQLDIGNIQAEFNHSVGFSAPIDVPLGFALPFQILVAESATRLQSPFLRLPNFSAD